MKKIGFIGAYSKTDMMMYAAKILTVLRKKVLIIDSTITQKAKYIVPVIDPTIKYITEFEEIDVAVGFKEMKDINKYVGIPEEKEIDYDYVLIDVDDINGFESFGLKNAEKNYFVTSFDLYSLKKGLEILSNLEEPINLTKVIFSQEILKEDDEYLNFLSEDYKVVWNEFRLYFPFENDDLTVIAENQRLAKIKFKKLSTTYKEDLVYLVQDLAKDFSESMIRKAMRTIEKGA